MFLNQTQRDLHLEERVLNKQRIIFDALVLSIASPEQIRSWAERKLSNGSIVGEVLHSKTVDYKTFKPLRDGLFCERIFGPVRDLYCSCGKKQPNKKITYCPDCEVDYCRSIARRHRLGYIDLFSSVTHLWYLKGRPNYIAVLLNKRPQNLEALVYCTTALIDAQYSEILPEQLTLPQEKLPQYNSFTSYRPCQTFPLSSTVSCDPYHRTKVLSYFVSYPEPEDHPIWAYASPSASDTTSTINQEADDLSNAQLEETTQVVDETTQFEDFLQSQLAAQNQAIQNLLTYTGGEAVKILLGRLDLAMIMSCLAHELIELKDKIEPVASAKFLTRRHKRQLRLYMKQRLSYARRFKIAQIFHRTQKNPAWMTISVLPVLPPNLRPIVLIDEQLVASDVNRLYQRVLFRNIRLKRTRILDLEIIGYSKRLLQEAVDALIDNGKGKTAPVLGLNDQPLKSLSTRLKGKRGRFRQNLLGKRVDYSGRSVIVVGPKMRLHQCGLPPEMALELFAPFLIRKILEEGYARNIVAAKRYVDTEHPCIWSALTQIMHQFPVLLNRAPTLHRLGIQAFQPHLVAGQAILLHPLVCSAFNADFDGDQMAVHVPLSYHARAEAWKLLWSRNNLLAPATGQPILVPSQDMVLGCYYLTTDGCVKNTKEVGAPKPKPVHYRWEYHYFNGFLDAMQAFSQEHVKLHTQVWLKLDPTQRSERGEKAEPPREIQIDQQGIGGILFSHVQEYGTWSLSTDQSGFQERYWHLKSQYILTTIGRIFMNHLFVSSEEDFPRYFKNRMKHALRYLGMARLYSESELEEYKSIPLMRGDSYSPEQ